MNLRQFAERSDRVFPTHPQVVRYFPAACMESARQRLMRSIERGDGPGVVVGPAGTGKSLLLQVLAAGCRERFDVVLLASAPLCTRRALLQAILFELGLEYHRRDEGPLRLSLLDQLLATDQTAEGLLLLVDEAQALSIQLLEELRVLTNVVRGGVSRVRLVLAGLPALEEKFAGPELESFSQRLTSRCYLGSFTREETAQYVRAQLAASAIEPDELFAADAWSSLYDATDGVPRLVNQLCDRALMLAVEHQLHRIDRALVQAAWADLQQLPVPWDSPAEDGSSGANEGGVIEFGSLDAEPQPTIVPADLTAAGRPMPAIEPFDAAPLEATPLAGVESEFVEPTDLDEEDVPFETSALGYKSSAEPEPVASPPAVNADVYAATEAAERPSSDVVAVAPSPPSSTPGRPRVFASCVSEPVHPFTGEFEEEELVIESFATMSCIFHDHTPQVENRRNPAFAQLLDEALRTSAVTDAGTDQSDAEEGQPTGDVPEPGRSSIRLAVVADSSVSDSEQFEPPTQPAEGQNDDVDEQPGQFDDVIISGHAYRSRLADEVRDPSESAAATFAASSDGGGVALDTDDRGDEADDVLIIEDEPCVVERSGPGVRREDYRHLFSRLRHGT
jgi:type II secretory pathway predicted ATPase ExeA